MNFSRITAIALALCLSTWALNATAQDNAPTTQSSFEASEAACIGTWNVDFARLAEAELAAATPEERAQMEAMFATMQMSVTVNADHTIAFAMNAMGQVEEDSGVWTVTATSGNTVNMSTTDNEGVTDEAVWTFFTADSVQISAEGDVLFLNRAE